MLSNFNGKLIALLKTDKRFVDDAGELIIASVRNHAWQLEHGLITLLMNDEEIEQKFFNNINGRWVFNYNTFITYISQKNFFGNSYTRFRNKIGLTHNPSAAGESRRGAEHGDVALVWPYKDCVLEGGQTREEETRQEIFFNECLAEDEINRLLATKVLTNWRRHTGVGKDKRDADGTCPVSDIRRDADGTIRENLIIKGNNLLALHSLKQQFRGKVKLIYIDAPYNTGGSSDTFTYNNAFNHSTWLTFMRNRLEVSRDLLKTDGIIVVAIDDVELFYLGVILDEIFGRKNKIGLVCIRHHPRGRTQSRFFSTVHEYALFYAKNIEEVKEDFRFDTDDEEIEESFIRGREDATPETRPSLYYPIFYNPATEEIALDNKGNVGQNRHFDDFIQILPENKNGMRTWKLVKESFLEELKEGKIRIKRTRNKYEVYRKIVRKKNKAKTMWTEARYDANHHGTNLLKKLFDGKSPFRYPKSLYTLLDILKLTTDAGDIVLDFFAGSGTTGHAVFNLNKYEVEGGGRGNLSLSNN